MNIVLIIAGTVVLAWLVFNVVKNHAPSMFAARVSGALFDLGIDARKLDDFFSKKLEIECKAFYGATKKKANPQLLAVRFFVFALIESDKFPIGAVTRDAPLLPSITTIRSWVSKGKLPSKFAEDEIGKIKSFLIKNLSSADIEKSEKLAMEIHVLEL